MRITILTLAALAVTTAAHGQSWADKMFKDGDKLVLSHDFGTIPRGTQMKHTFKITNIYAVRMEITQIKPSCGCVTATAAKRALEPRETGSIEVTMDGRRFTGPKSVNVRVTVGPEYISTAELKITANSRGDVVCNPGEVNFGTVAQGQTPTQVIDVEYAGNQPWQILKVTTNDAPYTATVKEMYRRTGQVGYRVEVKLKADAPAGVLRHDIILETNDKASPTVPVLVEANVQPSLSVAPAALELGGISMNTQLTRRVVVRAGRPFKVIAVDGTGAGIELGAPLGTNDADVQFVTFKIAFEKSGAFRREMRIKTSAQEAPVTVVIEGVAK